MLPSRSVSWCRDIPSHSLCFLNLFISYLLARLNWELIPSLGQTLGLAASSF